MKKKSIFLLLALLLAFPALFAAEKNDGVPLGINLGSFPSWEQPVFVDVFKQARSWISQRNGASWGGGGDLDLDENGWIKSFASTEHFAETPILDGVKCIPYGDYVVLYEGEGTITFGMSSVTVKSSTPGRIVINYNDNVQNRGIWLQVRSVNSSNYIKNIRVLMPGHEETYLTEPHYQPFLDVWRQYKVIRFMDWLATNGNAVTTWSQRSTPRNHTQASGKGIAWEYLIEFANLVKADPWICIPHLADDNYIRECARMLKKDLNPNAKIYLEYSNEVWNTQFEQTRHAEREGVRLGYAAANRPWEGNRPYYVRRSMEIFKIFEEEFGGADRFVRVLAWQTGAGIKDMMDFKYEIINGEGMRSLVGKKGSDLTDAHATAPYFGGYLGGQLEWVKSHTVDDILTACESDLQDVMNTVDRQVKEAAAYGKIFLAYEAGQHLAGTGGNHNNDDMTDKFIAANRHPRMKELYLNYLDRWKMSGAQTMCIFSSIGSPGQYGSWSIIENYCQDISETPKYAAVREFSDENTPAWWLLPPPMPTEIGEMFINFDCKDIPGTLRLARDYQITDNVDLLPFDMSDAGKVFDGGENTQATIYGGWKHIDRANPARKPEITVDNGFSIYMDAGNVNPPPEGVNQYSEGTGLFMWRADQFLQANPEGLSKLYLNIREYTDGKARFVVKNGGNYYMSEYVMTTRGEFELMEFDGSDMPSKRWLEVDMSDGDFGIAKFGSTTLTDYQALTLDDVTEVGFWITSYRPMYGHDLSFMSFKAYATPLPNNDPVNRAALTALIDECEDVLDNAEIGNDNGQYPAAVAMAFEFVIVTANQIDSDIASTQWQIDNTVLALQSARESFLASKIDRYPVLGNIIAEYSVIYDATKEGAGAGEYTKAARDAFKAAIDAAKIRYNTPNLTSAQIDAGVSDLIAAKQKYFDSSVSINYMPLSKLITECEGVYKSKIEGPESYQYSTAAHEAFMAAIGEAKKSNDAQYLSASELDVAVTALGQAKEVYLNANYYAPLKSLIAECEALYDETEAGTDEGQYPIEARSAFKAAIDGAKDIYATPDLTEIEVNNAIGGLSSAVYEYQRAVVVIGVCSVAYAQVNVYPNPVKDRLYFDAEVVPLSVRLFSTTGVLLLEAENVSEVDLSSLPQGVYLLQVIMSGESLMFNVLKE